MAYKRGLDEKPWLPVAVLLVVLALSSCGKRSGKVSPAAASPDGGRIPVFVNFNALAAAEKPSLAVVGSSAGVEPIYTLESGEAGKGYRERMASNLEKIYGSVSK